jgi:hypothetical protein
MGESGGTPSAPLGRARALWLKLWSRRTKVAGYAGVGFGAVQVAQGQSWHTLILGVTVALIGHYNDQHVGQA